MKLGTYLKDKGYAIIISFIGLILIIFLLVFLEAHILLIYSIPILYVAVLLLILLKDFNVKRVFFNETNNKLNNLDKKYLITEIINNASFVEGELFLNYLYEINKNYIEDLNKYKLTNKEFREYIELWCHEVKTPIATSKMIIDNNKNKTTENILEEVDRINTLIEQILFYARSDSVEEDYIISKVNLRDTIEIVIKKNKKALINNKVKININGSAIVESDTKWLEFIIDQIIVNSIKYIKNDPKIDIDIKELKNNVILTIKDNGIGIKSDEIDRVFDKGFTGSNGRIYKASTGMGLYLTKKLCDRLGHSITISSRENEYTKLNVVFPLSDMTK